MDKTPPKFLGGFCPLFNFSSTGGFLSIYIYVYMVMPQNPPNFWGGFVKIENRVKIFLQVLILKTPLIFGGVL